MPRVYVQPLGAYNAGEVGGAWVEVDSDLNTFQSDIDEVLDAASTADNIEEEWAFHDYEGFGGFKVDEYESVANLSRVVELMEEYGVGPVGAFLSYHGSYFKDDLDGAQDAFERSYRGEWEDEEEFVSDQMESNGQWDELPEWARPHFDLAGYTRDFFSGDHYSIDTKGGVYVFETL
jgi:antirestriction protein